LILFDFGKKSVNNNDMTAQKKKTKKRPVDNSLVLRYEDAWNYVVSNAAPWKQEIVIELTPEEADEAGGRTAQIHDEIAKEVMSLAESNRKIPAPMENWREKYQNFHKSQ
jgi:hypothetical protein